MRQTQNQFYGRKSDIPKLVVPGSLYVCIDERAIYIGLDNGNLSKIQAGGIGEAPIDGQEYVRSNGVWTLLENSDGIDGNSAYDIWILAGNTGTVQDFLDSLIGEDGNDGAPADDGAPGDSAYDIWLAQGNTGTEADFINSLNGSTSVSSDADNAATLGSDGFVFVSEATQNSGMPVGGVKRQVVEKNSATDNDYSWRSRYSDYLVNCEYTGVEYNISAGKVLEASIDSGVIFRLISSTLNANGYPSEDSFYNLFDGTTVSGKIAQRK
tara:strand:+ start:213 stop:1016 length:804 start_codon:yes stop_codon:yes gene_type:complete